MKPNICPRCHFVLPDIKRSNAQNRALHLFFEWIANMFNELGHTYTNPMGIETIWTNNMVKEIIWRPLQFSLFGIDSTTKLDTEKINIIADAIILHFSEQGYYLQFPSMESFLNYIDSKNFNK